MIQSPIVFLSMLLAPVLWPRKTGGFEKNHASLFTESCTSLFTEVVHPYLPKLYILIYQSCALLFTDYIRSVNVEIAQIILPAVKSKKAKKPEEEVVLTGLIERAVIKKYARDITISMHKATAMELMKVANGLTVFAEDVMYETNNKYTQKIYEIICQWKDVGVYTLSIEKFRELLVLKNKYVNTKILIRDIIRPAEKELKKIGDVFFDLSVTKRGNVITHFNFIIKTKALLKKENEHLLLIKEDTINLLRQHFGFKAHHLKQIEWILNDSGNITILRSKITELALKLADRRRIGQPIKDIPAWTIASIRNEFGIK